MDANYFLFATLENARHIAQGRMPQERTTPPVLTGTPVAGMVYLDRPKPAGYFIFPDLSVRHEGKYRLSFSLYEELKLAKDDDKMDDPTQQNAAGDSHVTHRLEVKSAPFTVYSAKKFPGLTESTSLSRMVAEQGCRVRIRRDVRMRRREPKSGSKEWDDYEDDTAAARARASETPDPNMYPQQMVQPGYMEPIPRPRSASNASHHSLGSLSRRPSMQDVGSAYHQPQYGTAPHTPQSTSYSQPSPYGQAQTQPYQQASFVQQPPAMQPPPPQYQPQGYPAPPPPPPVPQAHAQQYMHGYQPAPAPPQPQYNAPYEPAQPRSSVDYSSHMPTDYRRSSAQIPPPPPPPQVGYSQAPPQASYPTTTQPPYPQPPQAAQHSYSSSDFVSGRPAPMEPPRPAGASTPMSGSKSYGLPPINTTIMPSAKLEASSPLSAAPQNSYFAPAQPDTHKRSYGNVFSDRYQNGSLRQGARPSNYGQESGNGASLSAADDDNDASGELDPTTLGMAYRRADGRQIKRALPMQHV